MKQRPQDSLAFEVDQMPPRFAIAGMPPTKNLGGVYISQLLKICPSQADLCQVSIYCCTSNDEILPARRTTLAGGDTGFCLPARRTLLWQAGPP